MNNEKNLDELQDLTAEAPDETRDTTNHGSAAQTTESIAQNAPKTKKRKKFFLIAGAGAIVVLAIVAIFFFSGVGANINLRNNTTEASVISAKMKDDGTAYIPLMDGNYIAINDEVKSATITRDRNNIVVLLKDGTLYVTNQNQSAKNEIASDCKSIRHVRNDGFFYTDINDAVYRVSFSDFSVLKLGEVINYKVAENNMSVIFATDQGGIYTAKSTASDSIKVGSYSDSITLVSISDNGEIAVWVNEKDKTKTIVLNEGDDKVNLGEVNSTYDIYAAFTKDQGILIVKSRSNDCLWIKYPGKEPIKAKLGAELGWNSIYTSSGQLEDMQSGKVTSLYISTVADTGCNVYNISMEGDRERILSKVDDYYIANGNIFYTDAEKTLYYAKLNGNSISDNTKIASDVEGFVPVDNGKYVYYAKDVDYDNEVASMYCYRIGEADPLRVTSDLGMHEIYLATDGSLFFFKDVEKIPGAYGGKGTLMLWTYGNESASKISSEVVLSSVTSGLDSAASDDLSEPIDTKNFIFMKYNEVDSDGNVFVDWVHHDGKEATKFASDIILFEAPAKAPAEAPAKAPKAEAPAEEEPAADGW